MAFQLIDDLLDVTATDDDLGKPVTADLKLGLSTAPVLFANQQVLLLKKMKYFLVYILLF
jgi:geranylgeranyl pyrophosphate synthase